MTACYRRALRLAVILAITSVGGGAVMYQAEAALAQQVLGDVVLKRSGTSPPDTLARAVFPHWRHRLLFTCNVCHPAIFPMKGGETTITMDDFQDGKYCGVCHNGKIAWGVSISTCARCHAPQ